MANACDSKLVGGNSCDTGKRRPDRAYVTEDRIITVECDENSHRDREPSCELAKMSDTRWGTEEGQKRHICLRMNPDSPPKRIPLEKRVTVLHTVLREWLTCPIDEIPEMVTGVIYLYYGEKGRKHINAARESIGVQVLDEIGCE
jgi:hypothetical protein